MFQGHQDIYESVSAFGNTLCDCDFAIGTETSIALVHNLELKSREAGGHQRVYSTLR